MMPLPWIGGTLRFWRLAVQRVGSRWDSGLGAAREGGRWNPIGYPVVYCCADPATAILEVAVHTGFQTLDTIPHTLICAEVADVRTVHVIMPATVPNPNWLSPGTPGNGQQEFGKRCLEAHPFVMIPSAVTAHSWNLLFNPKRARGLYTRIEAKVFAMDTRLNPPQPPLMGRERAHVQRTKPMRDEPKNQ